MLHDEATKERKKDMSYTALYRKFRPSEFEDVKGQEHIVTTLRNQIKAERIGHAYLFCGTRGTGKTTIAKILAKAVNCEQPIDGSPCNTCSMCKAIKNQTSMNVIEIDAASNNGVDNIREIVDEVQYSPTEGKYKVYIIDEVHMLSTGAFNALLKTLEEPPSYVIFILATTEAHKIPITILSRCQRYDFKRITIETIAARLHELLEREGIKAEEKAVRYVAKAADGSMRDGLSLLEQCIAFYMGQELTYDKVLDVLGAVDVEIFGKMFQHIANNSVIGCIELLEELVLAGKELGQFVTEFIWYLRNLLLVKTSDQALDMIDISTEHIEILKKEAEFTEVEILMRYIRILSEVSGQLRYATQKRVIVEIALIKLCRPAMETNYDSILNRLAHIEKQFESGEFSAPISKDSLKKAENHIQEEKPKELPKALSAELQEAANNWNHILLSLSSSVRAMLLHVKVTVGEGDSLLLVFGDELEKKYFDKEEHLQELQYAIEKRIQKKVEVKTKLLDASKAQLNDIVDISQLTNMPVEYID